MAQRYSPTKTFATTIGMALILSSCAYVTPDSKKPVVPDHAAQLAKAMSGRFVSARDADGNRVNDFRAVIHKMGEGKWVYFQRNQGPLTRTERRAYRQRVLQLINQPDGSVSQITWSLKAPELYSAAPRNPGLLKSLSKKALKLTMEPGCEQAWQYSVVAVDVAGIDDRNGEWSGRVDPARCTIFSKRRNKRIAIGSETRLTKDALKEAERGFDLNGTQLWGTPIGAFTEMARETTGS